MNTEQVNRSEVTKLYKEAKSIYKNISKNIKWLNKMQSEARNEINTLKREIAAVELSELNKLRNRKNSYHSIGQESVLNKNDVLNKTDIAFHLDYITSQNSILKELYLEINHSDLLDSISDLESMDDYKDTIDTFPKNYRLWGIVWKLTRKNKKEELLRKIEKLNLYRHTYKEINESIDNVLGSVVNRSDNEFWDELSDNDTRYYQKLEKIHQVKKAKVSKDDFNNHKQTYNALEFFQATVEIMIQKKKDSSRRVQELIREENAEQVKIELQKTSLDEFSRIYSDSSLRLNRLAQVGIQTVADMDNYSSFLRIEGIGNVTNAHIKEALNHYKEDVNRATGIQFDPEHKSEIQTEIIRSLYIQVNRKDLYKELKTVEFQFSQFFYELMDGIYLKSEWAMQQLAKNKELMREFERKILKLKDFSKKYKKPVEDYLRYDLEISKIAKEKLWSNFNANAADYYAILERDYGVGSVNAENIIKRSGLSEEIIQKIKDFELNETGLSATLRSWQDFGTKYSLIQKKVLIGDEMGLGKTLISIASMTHLNYEEKKRHFLVICPASIMTNWERELKKFSKLKVFKAHGNYRDEILGEWEISGGVAITTYETASVLNFNDEIKIDMITVDEAHYAKNPDAKRTKTVRKLTNMSEYALYLTGTPLENQVQEMTEIIKPLSPLIAAEIRKPRVQINANTYRKKIASVYLRRTKEDVSLELPPLTQIEEWEEFGNEELEEYKNAVANGKFMRMRRAAWTGGTPSESPKLKRLVELTEEAYQNGNKVIIFSFFRDVIETVIETLGDRAVERVHGGVAIGLRQDIIDDFRDSKTRNVLVAQINTAAHGLNIQFANTIIFCEPQIKPSLESQAVARAYRMGQVNNVFVYRLLTVNSVDELMMEMLGNKQALFDQFADKSYLHEELIGIENIEEKEIDSVQSKIIDLESARLNITEKLIDNSKEKKLSEIIEK